MKLKNFCKTLSYLNGDMHFCYVSNVSIIFDCSMLLYYLFWMFNGFNMLFYIIFGTNLLTGGPVLVSVFFAYFRVLQKRDTKWSANGMKPSRWSFLDRKETGRLGDEVGDAMRRARGRRACPYLVGPSWVSWPSSFAYIYSYTLKTTKGATKPLFHRRNLLYPWDPI